MFSEIEHRVGMVDVDAVQINFAVYFRWMDHGFHALLHRLGHPLSGILREGFATPAVDASCNYRRPVGLDDEVVGRCWFDEIGRSSFIARHRFTHDGLIVAEGSVKHVWIASGPPAAAAPLPTWLREAASDAPPS
jgi:acyl-CoA thioester hydrolase